MSEEDRHMRIINVLRSEEGASVTICCTNPEGPPNECVEVSASWTRWESKAYRADCLDRCFLLALMDAPLEIAEKLNEYPKMMMNEGIARTLKGPK